MAGQRATAGHGMPGKMSPSIGSGSCAGFLLGRSPLQCQGTAGVCPGMVTGPCCCHGWWLLPSLLAISCLSCLLGWWQGHGLSFPGQPEDWWEIYKIQPVPTSPCYLWQAGRSASLFVEGQLSPWPPAHTQPCAHTASSQHVSQPAWDRGSFHRRRKVLSALRTWSVSAI